MRLIGALMVFVGCHSGGTVTPDTSLDPDAPPGGPRGLFVDWHAAVPGQLTDKIQVSEATFDVGTFEVVGDATVDSERKTTVRARYQLRWDEKSSPSQEAFYDAPPGLYSRVKINLVARSAGESTYEIRGTWNDDGQLREFRIEDPGLFPQISLDLDGRTLAAGGKLNLALAVELRDAVSNLDFGRFEDDDGVLELKNEDELDELRQRLAQAFKVEH